MKTFNDLKIGDKVCVADFDMTKEINSVYEAEVIELKKKMNVAINIICKHHKNKVDSYTVYRDAASTGWIEEHLKVFVSKEDAIEELENWVEEDKELKKLDKENKTRLMTNQELSWWLREHPEEHREYCIEGETCVCFIYHYNSGNSNEEVDEYIRIRKNGGEWIIPFIDV